MAMTSVIISLVSSALEFKSEDTIYTPHMHIQSMPSKRILPLVLTSLRRKVLSLDALSAILAKTN